MLVFAGFQVAVEVFHVDWSSCQKLIHLTHDTFVGPIIDNALGLIDKKKSIRDTDDQSKLNRELISIEIIFSCKIFLMSSNVMQ